MKVILKEEIDNLGNAGDLVMVKDGYARNYLIPRQLAIRADERNLKELEHHRRGLERRRTKLKEAAMEVEKQVNGVDRIVEVRACGPDGKLFGSVTSKDLVEAVKAAGVIIDRRQVQLRDPIKALGEHEVIVKLGQGHTATLQVSIEPDEASAQAIADYAREAAAEKAAADREAARAAREAPAEEPAADETTDEATGEAADEEPAEDAEAAEETAEE